VCSGRVSWAGSRSPARSIHRDTDSGVQRRWCCHIHSAETPCGGTNRYPMTGMPIASLEWLEVAYNLTRIPLECSVRQTRLIVLDLSLVGNGS